MGCPICPGKVTRGQRVFLAAGPTDMRRSFNGLSEIVRGEFGRDPQSREVFVFRNRGRNRLKTLLLEGAGMWVLAKRLERGTFAWQPSGGDSRRVDQWPEELALLLGGLDANELRPRRWKRSRVA